MDTFAILSEPTRRSIVVMVARHGELTATAIGERFRSSPPAISQHLKVLREADVLRVTKRGRERFYRFNASAIDEVDAWIHETRNLWNARLDRLDKLLASPKRSAGKQRASHTHTST